MTVDCPFFSFWGGTRNGSRPRPRRNKRLTSREAQSSQPSGLELGNSQPPLKANDCNATLI